MQKAGVNCVVRNVESKYYEHADYILNIKCIFYPERPHNIFILFICLTLDS